MKRCETVVISKSLHDQRPDSTALMSGPRQGGHWVDGMAKKMGGSSLAALALRRRFRSCADFHEATRDRTISGLCQKKPRPTVFSETSGTRMSERIRTSTVIMSWNSRRQDGQREAGESPLIFFAGIFPSPGPETVLFLCGPTPTMNAVEEIIRGLSYPEKSVILP